MVIAIVGDVNPAEARRMAERYFGPMRARPLPPVLHTEEPPQSGPRTAVVESASQPVVVVGYKRPDNFQKDDPVFDVIQLIVSQRQDGLALPRTGAGEAPGAGGAGFRARIPPAGTPVRSCSSDGAGTGTHRGRRYQGVGRGSDAAAGSKSGRGDVESREDPGAGRCDPQAGQQRRAWPPC